MGAHDLDDADWGPWIDRVAPSMGVDGGTVDVPFIHALTQAVAREVARPMAPVSAYLLGLAAATHPERSVEELRDVLLGVAGAS